MVTNNPAFSLILSRYGNDQYYEANDIPLSLTSAYSYRFGFNGQQKENDISGAGNHNTALFWEYDTRLGRRWNRDPIVKAHESSYACFGNTPIWSSDENGDDSTLASGSKTWVWTAEEGDTYESISKRTKVSIDNLKNWNSFENNKIPTNSSVNISDPSSSSPSEAAGIPCDDGMIYVNQYTGWNINSGGLNRSNQGIMLNFTPSSGSSAEQYRWYQTLSTNDPSQRSFPGDIHYDAWKINGANGNYYSSDQFGTWRAGMKIIPNIGVGAEGTSSRFNRSGNQVSSFDIPGRFCVNDRSPNAYWKGTTSLVKIVNNERIILATFTWGFERGPCNITSYPLRFNQSTKGREGENSYHRSMLKSAK